MYFIELSSRLIPSESAISAATFLVAIATLIAKIVMIFFIGIFIEERVHRRVCWCFLVLLFRLFLLLSFSFLYIFY